MTDQRLCPALTSITFRCAAAFTGASGPAAPPLGRTALLSCRRPSRLPARRLPRPRTRPLSHQTPGPFSFAAVLGPDRCAASQDAAPYLLQRQLLRRQRLRVPVRARAAPMNPFPRGPHQTPGPFSFLLSQLTSLVYSQTLTAISIFKYVNIVCIIQVHTTHDTPSTIQSVPDRACVPELHIIYYRDKPEIDAFEMGRPRSVPRASKPPEIGVILG